MKSDETAIDILGSRIDCFYNYRELYDRILNDRYKGARYVTVNNVHTIMVAYKNRNYRDIINNAYLSIPDGKPLVVVGKLKGQMKISRLFGPTVMERFIDWGRDNELKHFIFGSTEDVLEKLKFEIAYKYPGAQIVGMISPPFVPVDQWNSVKYFESINNARPDIIWVGLGAPKQEKWMNDNLHLLDAGVMFGIGAGFSYMAGITKHAPDWMKKNSLEWLFRLCQEPKRLWRRYLQTIPPFIICAFCEVIKQKVQKLPQIKVPKASD